LTSNVGVNFPEVVSEFTCVALELYDGRPWPLEQFVLVYVLGAKNERIHCWIP